MFLCTTCGKSYMSNKSLKRHERLKHQARCPYHCCGKNFSDRTEFTRHRCVRHTDVRRFECEVCSSKFATRSDLNRHTRMVHGERPFVCEVCNVRFSRDMDLRDHMAGHTGVRRHRCICGKAFVYASGLYRHRMRCVNTQ